MKAVRSRGNGSVLVMKAVKAQGKGSVLATKAVQTNRAEAVSLPGRTGRSSRRPLQLSRARRCDRQHARRQRAAGRDCPRHCPRAVGALRTTKHKTSWCALTPAGSRGQAGRPACLRTPGHAATMSPSGRESAGTSDEASDEPKEERCGKTIYSREYMGAVAGSMSPPRS